MISAFGGFLKQYKNGKTKAFTMLLILALCEGTIFIYPVALVRHFSMFLGNLIFPLLYLVLFTASLGYHGFKNLKVIDFLFVLSICIYVAFSYVFNPSIQPYVNKMLQPQLLPCIPFFFLGICCSIDDINYKTIAYWSCLGILLTSLYEFSYSNSMDEEAYDMGASYVLLMNILLVIDYSFKTKEIIPIICSIIGVFYSIAMGTRGPIVIILVLIVLEVLFIIKNNQKYRNRSIVIVLCVAAALYFIYDHYLEQFIYMFSDMNFSTRVVEYAITGDFVSHTSGRDDIYEVLVSKLETNPLTGYGFFAEWPLGFWSAHNMYLELAFHYGYPVAIIIILLYSMTIKKGYGYANELTKRWIIVWGCSVFVRGIFGGMYFSYEVFFLLGLCIQSIRNKKNAKALYSKW